MYILQVLFGAFSIGLLELIIFQAGALILGFAIHFFWTSRKSLPYTSDEPVSEFKINEADEWRLKYYEEMDLHEKLQQEMRKEIRERIANEKMQQLEVVELKAEIKELEAAQIEKSAAEPSTYLNQLMTAQENLAGHNEHLSKLLEQVEVLKQLEKKHLETQKINDELQQQLRDAQLALSSKGNEIRQIRQHQGLAAELQERLQKVYDEFNLMQDKVVTLESHLSKPHLRGYEYEDLQQAYFRLTKDFDEMKGRQQSILEENQRQSRMLADTEDKLRESQFVRQQLTKKVAFLDELNTDLQQVASQNKKLETQLRRIAEIEQMLMKVPEQENETPPGTS